MHHGVTYRPRKVVSRHQPSLRQARGPEGFGATFRSSRLSAQASIGQIEILAQLDRGTNSIDRASARVFGELRAWLHRETRGSYHQLHQRALAILSPLPGILSDLVYRKLEAMALLGHRLSRRAMLKTLPDQYLRSALRSATRALHLFAPFRTFPHLEGLLEDEPEGSTRPGAIQLSARGRRVVKPALSKKDYADYLFPAPDKAKIKSILAPFTADAETDRMPRALAGRIATGFSLGKTPAQVEMDIRPFFDGSRVRAKRAARTFGALVATEQGLETHRQMGDMLQGWQIHATLDQFTRPHHAARSGTIYYVDPKPGQLGVEVMPRPPLEGDGSMAWNCRCWLTPVLTPLEELETAPEFTTADDQLIPDPLTYSDWFSDADERRRKIAVGSRRYDFMADSLDREPSWEDFLDPETGQLLSLASLKDESQDEQRERLTDVFGLFARLRGLLLRAARLGSVA